MGSINQTLLHTNLVLSLHALSVLLEVELERLDVVVEAEGGHGEEDVLPVDGLPLLRLTSENEMQKIAIPCYFTTSFFYPTCLMPRL